MTHRVETLKHLESVVPENRPLAVDHANHLAEYVELLLTWNRSINLTGAKDAAEIVELHLPDAFAVARLSLPGTQLVDIGAGGGLPGLPVAILRPDLQVTLVEPRAKRTAFLREAIRKLGLAATVREARSEDLEERAWDVALSRATFPPETWLPQGQRLVRRGGQILVFTRADSPWTPPGRPPPRTPPGRSPPRTPPGRPPPQSLEGVAKSITYQAKDRERRLWQIDCST